MFRSVEYAGLDRDTTLRRLAESGTRVLASEISVWHDRIDVVWEPTAGPPIGLNLSVSLDLPIGGGTGTRLIPVGDFSDDETLRSRVRSVWDRALGAVLEKRKHAWDEYLRQPVGA